MLCYVHTSMECKRCTLFLYDFALQVAQLVCKTAGQFGNASIVATLLNVNRPSERRLVVGPAPTEVRVQKHLQWFLPNNPANN